MVLPLAQLNMAWRQAMPLILELRDELLFEFRPQLCPWGDPTLPCSQPSSSALMSQLGLGVESMDGVGVGDGDSWGDPVPIGETDHTDPDFGLWEFHASLNKSPDTSDGL